MQRWLVALVEGLLGRGGTIFLIAGLVLTVVGLLSNAYRRRRRLTFRKAVDGKLGLVADPDASADSEVGRMLRTLNEVSVVAVRFRNTGNGDIEADHFSSPIRLRFTRRYIIDFRISEPDPALIRAHHPLRDEITNKAFVDVPTAGEQRIDQDTLRKDLPSALSGALPGVDKDRRYNLTLDPFDLPAHARFTLLVHLHERTARTDDQVTKGYQLDGGLHRGKGKLVDANWAPRFTPIRVLSVLAALLAGALIVVLLVQGVAPFPTSKVVSCGLGGTKLVGSTAFKPVTKAIAGAYNEECGTNSVTVAAAGSLRGIHEVEDAPNANDVATLSDGPAENAPGPQGRQVAVVVYALVVNREVGIERLSLDQVRGIYQGRYTNWRQLGSTADLPIRLVSRNADSGTRRAFEKHVLNAREPAVTSDSCVEPTPSAPPPIRCERWDTAEVLRTVDRVPGALGYAESGEAASSQSVRLRLDGREPVVEALNQGYPFWTIEYLYTKGVPSNDSVLKHLSDYLATDTARERIRAAGYLPCVEPNGAILDQCNEPR